MLRRVLQCTLLCLKESNPVEIAEHAVASKLVEEPAFKWWVASVLRRRNRIVSKLKSRHWKTTHKFGIQAPKPVDEACKIDLETGTDFWTKAISKEMRKVKVAFNRWDQHQPLPVVEFCSCDKMTELGTPRMQK